MPVTNPPLDGVIYGFLLTDGSLLFQGGLLQDFYRFKPDKTGSYENGTFYPAAALPPNYIPYATSGGVLPDGRVLLIGGEYLLGSNNTLNFSFTNKMAIYDPKTDKWTMVAPPFGPDWDFIGDLPWTLLPNGHLLLGEKFTKAMAELDPTTLTWTEVSSHAKDDRFAEEGLTLLPDGSVLTVNMTELIPYAQRYIPNADPSKSAWVDAGTTPVILPATDTNWAKNIIYDNGMRVYHPPGEIGPAILRPDGMVFVDGAVCTNKGPPHGSECLRDLPPGRPHRGLRHEDRVLDGRPRPPPHGGRGRYLVQPAAERECLCPNQSARIHRRSGSLAPTLATRASATARAISSPPKPKRSCRRVHRAYIWRFYEFDGTNLIPEPAATFCNNQPSMLLLADRPSDAEPQLRLHVLGQV